MVNKVTSLGSSNSFIFLLNEKSSRATIMKSIDVPNNYIT